MFSQTSACVDKENITAAEAVQTKNIFETPSRTPLHDVNGSTAERRYLTLKGSFTPCSKAQTPSIAPGKTAKTPVRSLKRPTKVTFDVSADIQATLTPQLAPESKSDLPELTDTGTMMTPKKEENEVKSTEGNTSVPVAMATTSTMVTPVKTAETGQMVSPVAMKTTSTTVTPVKTVEQEQMMSPVTMGTTATMVTPVKTTETGQMTSHVAIENTATMTTPISLRDAGGMTSPVKTHDQGQAMSPMPSLLETNIIYNALTLLHYAVVAFVEYSREISWLSRSYNAPHSNLITITMFSQTSACVDKENITAAEAVQTKNIFETPSRTPLHDVNGSTAERRYLTLKGSFTPCSKAQTPSIAPGKTAKTPVRSLKRPTKVTFDVSADIQATLTPQLAPESKSDLPELTDTGTMMTPKKEENEVKSTEGNTSVPVAMATTSTMVTPVKTAETGQMVSPVAMKTTSTTVTPVKTVEQEQMMSPVTMGTTATMVTPVKTTETGQMTSHVAIENTATMTTPISLRDAGGMTSPVKTHDQGQAMSPMPSLLEAGTTVTPVKYESTGQATSPVSMSTTETAMTPPPVRVSTGTVTSPVQVPFGRFSEIAEVSHLDPVNLAHQLESAGISNELLRGEITSLRDHCEQRARQLDQLKEDLATKEVSLEEYKEKILHVELEAKASGQEVVADLMTQLGQQMSQIADLESKLKSKDQVIIQMKEAHDTGLRELQERQQKTVEMLQQKNQNLQDDLCTAYKQHKKELAALKEEHSRFDYKSLYHKAQQTIAELEAELEVYSSLKDAIEEYERQQEAVTKAVQESHSNVIKMFEKVQEQKEMWATEHTNWQAKMNENDIRTQAAVETSEQARKQMEDFQQRADEAIKELNKMKEIHRVDAEELLSATEQITELTAQLNYLNMENHKLTKQVGDYEVKQVEHFQEVITLEAAQKVMERELMKEKEIGTKTAERLKDLNHHLEEEFKRFDLEVLNLQRTLDYREQDVERLEQQLSELQVTLQAREELVDKLKAAVHAQRLELEANCSVKRELIEVKEQLEMTQTQSKEMYEFLEEERRGLTDTLRESGERLSVTNLELSRCRTEVQEKTVVCLQMENTIQNMSQGVQLLQEELDNTKANAHLMLMTQDTEISDSMLAVDGLCERMRLLVEVLEEKAAKLQGVENETPEYQQAASRLPPNLESCKDSPSSSDGDVSMHVLSPPLLSSTVVSHSLVSSILSAVRKATDTSSASSKEEENQEEPNPAEASTFILEENCENNPSASDSEKSGKQLNSVIHPGKLVTNDAPDTAGHQRKGLDFPDSTVAKTSTEKVHLLTPESDMGETDNKTVKGSAFQRVQPCQGQVPKSVPNEETKAEEEEEESEEESLTQRISRAAAFMEQIVSLVQLLHRITFSSIKELEKENDYLKGKIAENQSMFDKNLVGLKDDLKSTEIKSRKLQVRLEFKVGEVKNLQESLDKAERRICEMAEQFSSIADQKEKIQKYSKEIDRLSKQVKSVELERTLLQEQLKDCLSRIDDLKQGLGLEVTEGKHILENHVLKKEKLQLNEKLLEKREEVDILQSKLDREMKKYSKDLKEAQTAIFHYDRQLENIRKVLEKHQYLLIGRPDLQKVMSELSGENHSH
ncbi:COP1-interactive protein 1 [Lingula anatina]|uniref:COP1-interactive protein 1 n=1 Tax=Lingula anatina TaxID=7574 RepID=A0A1S3KGW4_LINAN|nr:COP1-interactive protein 1 [Lingula anatina]|eukprot:XP_013421699.1 COP1-interactive protein 1 [Lingula anatina]